eukprot:12896956-Alexandrium_andersonii.AAC.1
MGHHGPGWPAQPACCAPSAQTTGPAPRRRAASGRPRSGRQQQHSPPGSCSGTSSNFRRKHQPALMPSRGTGLPWQNPSC